jgi:VWFA-related protein
MRHGAFTGGGSGGSSRDRRPCRRWLTCAAACLVAAVVPRAAAAGPQITLTPSAPQITLGQPSTFKSGVELIAIDVTVLDKSGEPVRGLSADRFQVSVDGRPRRVVSAELLDYTLAAAGVGKAASGPAYSSNDAPGGTAPAPGRLVFLAVDEGSFLPAAAGSATEAARRFVARLQPQDRVGMVTFPAPGKSVSPSTNHVAVTEALSRIIGSAEPIMDAGSPFAISLTEAVDIQAGDTLAFSRASDRVCRTQLGGSLQQCEEMLRNETKVKVMRAEVQVARTLQGLRGVMTGLAGIQERKTIVVVSAGMPAASRIGGGLDTQSEISSIARDAAAANATIYVLHVDRTFMEASAALERRPNPTLFEDASMLGTGLEALASASGGTLLRVSVNPDAAFDRIARESASSYVLALEPGPADYDGKPHAIKVAVSEPGAAVRSRREFVLTARAAPAEAAGDPLAEALRSPRPVTGLRVGVSTRTLGQAASGGLRVLITANLGRGLPGAAELRVAFKVTDAQNRTVASNEEKKRLRVSPANPDASASYAVLVALAPGTYTLRIAAMDDGGRVGSVSHSFAAGVAPGDGIAVGDLLLMEPARAVSDDLQAFPDGRMRGSEVGAYLEMDGPGAPAPTVTFALAEREETAPLVQVKGTIGGPNAAAHSTAAARVDLGLVPPGDYVLIATVSREQKVLARRTHPLHVSAPAAAAAGTEASALLPRVRFVLGPSAGLVGAFARPAVLASDVLAYFAGRLRAADRGPLPAGASEALAALDTGEYDGAIAALREATPDRLSVVFIRGLALLGKGELEPAAAQFRAALRLADDFLPAAFYLGACYAAGGRDSEAAGAWQMALVTEDDARIVYDVLADALLRQGDAARAAEIITEARERWKNDEGFAPRLAVAQAMLARPADALATLGQYLEGHRSDTEAAALAVRMIYEAHAAGKTVTTAAADGERAEKYASWYRAAGGASQALVDRWVAFILKS